MKGVWPSTFLSVRREVRGAGLWVRMGDSSPRQRVTSEGGREEGGGDESLSPSSLAQGAGSGGSRGQKICLSYTAYTAAVHAFQLEPTQAAGLDRATGQSHGLLHDLSEDATAGSSPGGHAPPVPPRGGRRA